MLNKRLIKTRNTELRPPLDEPDFESLGTYNAQNFPRVDNK